MIRREISVLSYICFIINAATMLLNICNGYWVFLPVNVLAMLWISELHIPLIYLYPKATSNQRSLRFLFRPLSVHRDWQIYKREQACLSAKLKELVLACGEPWLPSYEGMNIAYLRERIQYYKFKQEGSPYE